MNYDIIVIDALNLFTRHYVAHPAMSENGYHVGGIVGFFQNINTFIEDYRPKKMYVIWESGGSVRKRAIFKEYKEKRRPQKLNRTYEEIPDTIENRNKQIAFITKALKNTPICQLYVPDCEADDIIGYMCKNEIKDRKILIISSDRDYYQLVSENIHIYSPTWKKIVTSIEIKSKFNISPVNFCMAKCLTGDSSDNISGVPGAGYKTVSKRYPELLSDNSYLIDDIICISKEMIEKGSKISIYKKVIDSEKIIRRNWKLIYLDTSCLSYDHIKKMKYQIDTFRPSCDKFSLIRDFIKAGIKKFNFDRLFLSISTLKRN